MNSLGTKYVKPGKYSYTIIIDYPSRFIAFNASFCQDVHYFFANMNRYVMIQIVLYLGYSPPPNNEISYTKILSKKIFTN